MNSYWQIAVERSGLRLTVMIAVGLCCFMLLTGCQEQAVEQELEPIQFRLQVSDYGLYQRPDNVSEEWSNEAELLRQRRKLELGAQTSFGFRFMLHADPAERPVTLTYTVKPPVSENGLKSLQKKVVVMPEQFPYQGSFIHTLEDADSLVPGTWLIYLKADGELLSRQPFQLLPSVQP
ncbi:DUF3859 domain-containing protein [Corallincola holothuriorum]|uniref:DUF3859 domain-containing protein n=1 Tax=Corallincola holothuriorum TaxID=2282215 RepID=A0A368N7D2_9GAMM|nr:DUF3859 domain-containing protein [Corallincola holothuriorum]RCU45491.1 DUF3859 domain-containing protein [Corallincola holothuriorum]